MKDEEIKQKFKETYTEYMYGDTPLSPYFDIWCYAIEIMEQENEKLDKQIDTMLEDCKRCTYRKTSEQLEQAKEIIRTFLNMPMPNNEEVFADVGIFLTKAEQFLRETDIDNAIQKANEGLDLDKIADEVEQDIKEQKVK